MFNLRFTNAAGKTLRLGHGQSRCQIIGLNGIDGIPVSVITSQGFDQIGVSVDDMTVGERPIGLIGRIYNCTPAEAAAIDGMFLPLSTVRMYFEDRYWIDVAIKETPAWSYKLAAFMFSVSLMAPYPYWKSVVKNYYKLGGTVGGFNFPVSYNVPHNFGLYNETLFLNCVNNGNTQVDFLATITAKSGTAENITLTNAANQKFITVNTTVTAADTVSIFRENNILRVTKETGGVVQNIFSALDEDSNLFFMDVGDNVIRATADSGGGNLIVSVEFYDTVTGVRYGI